MEPIILKSYKRDRDESLTTSATRVDEMMDNNPDFTDPPPALAELRQVLPEYTVAVADAKGRDRVAVSRKKDLKAKIVALLTEIDAYVTSKSKGDRTMMLTSGFYLVGDKSNVATQIIGQLEVKLGPPGILTTSVKRIRGVKTYLHQYTTEPPTSTSLWTSQLSPQHEFTFSGLASGKTHWLRVAILSHTGQTVYSPIEVRIVQ